MNTHTEPPWNLHPAYNGESILIMPEDSSEPWTAWCFRIAKGDKIVCEVSASTYAKLGFPHPTTREEALANAELIIRAVNCHDELVAALEAMAAIIGPPEAPAWSDDDQLDAAWGLTVAALAKAKGEAP